MPEDFVFRFFVHPSQYFQCDISGTAWGDFNKLNTNVHIRLKDKLSISQRLKVTVLSFPINHFLDIWGRLCGNFFKTSTNIYFRMNWISGVGQRPNEVTETSHLCCSCQDNMSRVSQSLSVYYVSSVVSQSCEVNLHWWINWLEWHVIKLQLSGLWRQQGITLKK